MSRFLIVFRHGKSDWGASGGDHERPLKKRGIRAAKRMGRHLTETDQVPDLVLSSSAVRARTTAELALEAGSWGCPLHIESSIYESSIGAVLEVVRAVDDSVKGLVVTGHEPTSSALVATLVGGRAPTFPTAAMARIDFDVSWSGVDAGVGRLAWVLTPRELD